MNLNGANTLRVELNKNQVSSEFWRNLILTAEIMGLGSLSRVGQELIKLGMESYGLEDKINEEAKIKGITYNNYVKWIMTKHGYSDPLDEVLKRHNCVTFEQLLFKLKTAPPLL